MKMSTNLLDTYVSEVGRQLPQKSRADIEAEIRSALQDMLDERAKQSEKPVDDEMTLEILQAYGSPEKVAASYQLARYLIGPQLYPAFIKVVQIVVPVVGVIALLGLGFSLGRANMAGNTLFDVIGKAMGEFFGSMISALGSIAIIFAILERFVPGLKMGDAKWDARSLLKVTPPDRVKMAELIVEIFFTGLAIVIFNFFPELINIGYYSNGSWWVGLISTQTGEAWKTTLLSDAFFRYLPALNIIWALTIVLDSLLLDRGRWETWSRWFQIGVKALMISLAAVMLSGPSLIGITTESLNAVGFPSTAPADLLVNLLNQVIRLALVMIILVGGLDVIKALIRMFRGKKPVSFVSVSK
jgi:hypothetical protein